MKDENYYQITCKHCRKSIHSKVFSQHLRCHHNIKFLEYVKENLSDFQKFGWNKCVICGVVSVSRSKSHNQPTCSTKCLSELRTTWVGNNSTRIGSILSDETKQKISKANTGKKGICGDLNPACRKEVREKISKTRIERGVAKGEKNGMFGKTHTPEAIKKIFSRRPMNRLEKKVADELKRNGIEYTFQFFITEDKVCKSYDFKIKGKPIIIEVDGDFWHGNPNTTNHFDKVDDVKENDLIKEELAKNRGYFIVRLWESDINKDISIVMNSLK
jgi:very-short-patch-repair endonuclease/endogenous inhibitor of DNA gyrase (YacG/DUF329 family)